MTRPTALITGATAGIGFHTAAALARAGMRVLVTGRDEERGQRAVSQLQGHAGHADVELIVADGLSIRESVFVAHEAVGRAAASMCSSTTSAEQDSPNAGKLRRDWKRRWHSIRSEERRVGKEGR